MEALLNIAGARGGAGGGFLGAHDAERLIESLRDFEVDDVGSARWTEQRESLERLNVQAHHNAVTHSDEFVKELLVSHDKVKTLVRELLVAEVWKEKVYPRFDEDAMAGVVATEVYLAHHHEATLCNLLEIAFFHKDACEAAGDDALLELTDYCVRKLVYLVGEGEGRRGAPPRRTSRLPSRRWTTTRPSRCAARRGRSWRRRRGTRGSRSRSVR